MKLATAKQMKEIDRHAIEELGIPGIVLMENAGAGCARTLMETFETEAVDGVVVLCGMGNNGGDGFVVARHLWNNGFPVEVYLLGKSEKVRGDARLHFDILERMGVPVTEVVNDDDTEMLEAELGTTGVIVDALFGTGLDRDVTGRAERAIRAVNDSPAKVVAVDIPSGLDGDTGRVLGLSVFADLTCTFGLGKIGLVTHPGYLHCGEVVVLDISLPGYAAEEFGVATSVLEPEDFMHLFAPRPDDSHKGDFGHALVVGGSPGMTGAPSMSAMAVLRSGAGLATLAVPREMHLAVEAKVVEVMSIPLTSGAGGVLGEKAAEEVLAALAGKNVLAIGPGMGQSADATRFIAKLLPKLDVPVIIDADGLNNVAADPNLLKTCPREVIITPHPGEMARLMGTDVKAVMIDRVGAARKFAARYGVTVVLKGARTVVAAPDGRVWINTTGNPGMATAGAGDVLTGVIAGMIAQFGVVREGLLAGVFLHGLAGDLAQDLVGERGLVAGDILNQLPAAIIAVEDWYDEGLGLDADDAELDDVDLDDEDEETS